MLLANKNAIVYGAGGAVGGAVARAFAHHGARVFLAGRHLAPVQAVARIITSAGGTAEAAEVDALEEQSILDHFDLVEKKAGQVDISFNAIGIPQPGIQGIPLTELPVDSFLLPVVSYVKSHFLTSRSAARHMIAKGSGVILMHTPSPAREGTPLVGGMAPAWAAMEALSRNLSAEFGAQGVRAVCFRTTGMPETATIDVVFGLHAKAIGMTREQFQALMEGMSHRRRSTTLKELTDAAVFAASDMGAGITGAVLNLTGGKAVD
jgi:NAD(P)-dependent dehydrogenase (short-subunit alcohol dehydrogenase family)